MKNTDDNNPRAGVLSEQLSHDWWNSKREELYSAFHRDPQEGKDEWLRTYAESLVLWDLEACYKLASESFPFPSQAADLLGSFQYGSKALSDKKYAEALEMLAYITEVKSASQSQFLLGATRRAALLVLMGRICLFAKADREAALKFFKQAIELSPTDGLPHAAMGDYYRTVDDQTQAMEYYQWAIRLSPKQSDGYVGMALLCGRQQAWTEAREWYLRAVQTTLRDNGSLDLTQILSAKGIDRMLQTVIQPINIEYNSETNYREGIAYELKGLILETLQRRTEAAEAYYEAGRRFGWGGEPQGAIEVLTVANELNPSHVPTYWSLADAWRTRSYVAAPPYVDQALVEKSLAIWETGFRIQPPDANNSWAYITRALINEQLARLPAADRWTLWWESVAYLERAILLSEWEVYRWAYLARFHRYLATESVALEATREALDLGPNELVALEERAAILANVGQFEEAETTIDKRRELQPSPWADGLKAYILLHQGGYQAALDLINSVVNAEPDNIWNRNLRAVCFQMLDEPVQAAEDYRWIWDRYAPPDVDNHSAFGWAAYNLGKIDDAVAIFSKLLDEPTQIGFTYRSLGLFYLTRGDLRLGEETLDKGISLAINSRELDSFLNIDLKYIEKSAASWPHDDRLREIVEGVKHKVMTRRQELEERRSAPEELEHVILQLAQGETHGWSWIGAHAGLARLRVAEKQWSDATKIYRQLLQKEPNRFLEARLGLERVTDGLRSEGDSLKDSPSAALEKYNQALEITLQLPLADSRQQADLHSRFGYTHLRLQNISQARRHFIRAAQLYRRGSESSVRGALGSVCRSLLRNSSEYWQLEDELKALEDEAIDAQLREDLAEARKYLAEYFNESYQLSAFSGESSAMLPVVNPIVVEIGKDLIPEGPEKDLINKYLLEMRGNIFDETGVQVPGTRIRRNDDELFAGQYIIMLDEILVVSGNVEGRNLEVWPDALAYIVNQLEAVLRRNLADFLGIQEVENLLDSWSQTEPSTSLITETLPDKTSRLRFARVLRGLVKERVPISQWKIILDALQEIGLPKDDTSEAVRIVRLRLKKFLPGNDQDSIRVELPWPVEEKLLLWISHDGEKTFFAMPPKETQEALSGIRKLIDRNNENVALVTRSGELRPFIRRLVVFEFPDVMVLSQDELIWSMNTRPGADTRQDVDHPDRLS